MSKTIKIYIDACTTGIGIYSKELIWGYSAKIESKVTVNEAEWLALLQTLYFVGAFKFLTDGGWVKSVKSHTLVVYTDSQLVANQFNKKWKVKNGTLLSYYNSTRRMYETILDDGFKVKVKWISSKNPDHMIADKLSRRYSK